MEKSCNTRDLEGDMNELVSHLNERDSKDMKVMLRKT